MTWTSTGSISNPDVQRTNLAQEQKVVPISLVSLRVFDAMHTNLPGTASGNDAALVTGTPGTDALTVQGQDSGGLTTEAKFGFEYILPPEYVDGADVKIRAKGLMLTTVASDVSTIDFQAYRDARTGLVGADLVATSAQSINSLTAATFDFTVTATTLASGDKIIVVGDMDCNDVGDAGVMIPELQALEMVIQVKG